MDQKTTRTNSKILTRISRAIKWHAAGKRSGLDSREVQYMPIHLYFQAVWARAYWQIGIKGKASEACRWTPNSIYSESLTGSNPYRGNDYSEILRAFSVLSAESWVITLKNTSIAFSLTRFHHIESSYCFITHWVFSTADRPSFNNLCLTFWFHMRFQPTAKRLSGQ
jgi:hypothetical protein